MPDLSNGYPHPARGHERAARAALDTPVGAPRQRWLQARGGVSQAPRPRRPQRRAAAARRRRRSSISRLGQALDRRPRRSDHAATICGERQRRGRRRRPGRAPRSGRQACRARGRTGAPPEATDTHAVVGDQPQARVERAQRQVALARAGRALDQDAAPAAARRSGDQAGVDGSRQRLGLPAGRRTKRAPATAPSASVAVLGPDACRRGPRRSGGRSTGRGRSCRRTPRPWAARCRSARTRSPDSPAGCRGRRRRPWRSTRPRAALPGRPRTSPPGGLNERALSIRLRNTWPSGPSRPEHRSPARRRRAA